MKEIDEYDEDRRDCLAKQTPDDGQAQVVTLGASRMTLGERIKSLRRERGWTLRDMAEHTGLSVSYHSDIETDRTDPALKTLVKLADAFQMKVVEMLFTVDLGEAREPLPFDTIESQGHRQHALYGHSDE